MNDRNDIPAVDIEAADTMKEKKRLETYAKVLRTMNAGVRVSRDSDNSDEKRGENL